jgi:hypothetical protein
MSSNCIQFKDKPEIPCENINFPSFDKLKEFNTQEFNTFISDKFNSPNFKFKEDYINSPTAEDNDFSLRQQQMFVSKYANFHNNFQGLLIYHGLGSGKCHGINTAILMYDGSIKMVQDVIEGDLLMGDDSKPRTVLRLGRGRDTLYEVRASNGETFTCNSEHILSLKLTIPYIISPKIINVTIKDYIRQFPINNNTLYNNTEFNINTSLYKLYKKPIDYTLPKSSLVNCDFYNLGKKFVVGDTPDIKITSLISRELWVAGVIDTYATLDGMYYKLPFNDLFVNYILGSIGIITYTDNTDNTDNICNKIIASSAIKTRKFPVSNIHDTGLIDFEIIEKENNKYYGFTLDANSLYVLGNHYITHNTCTSILVGEAYKAYNDFRNLQGTNFSHDSRIIVVVPPSVLQQFKEEIYGKLLEDGHIVGCTSNVEYNNKQIKYIKKVMNQTDSDRKKKIAQSLGIVEESFDKDIKSENILSRHTKLAESEKQNIDIEIKKYWNIMTHIGFINNLVHRTDRDMIQNITKQLQRGNSLVIIDEIQNLISESGIMYYKLINTMKLFSHNNRIVALSATPIYDKPYEIGLILNILNPRMFFPNNQNDFNNMFYKTIDNPGEEKQIVNTNMDLFYWMCNGYVSYFSGGNPRDFPFKRIIEKHHIMEDPVADFYFKTLANEIRPQPIRNEDNEQTKNETSDQINQTFLTKVRQYCNIVFPSDIAGDIIMKPSEKLKDFMKSLNQWKEIAKSKDIKNWVEQFLGIIAINSSSKMASVTNSILVDAGTSVIFSDLRTYGVEALATILDSLGFIEIKPSHVKTQFTTLDNFNRSIGNPSAPRYTIWSGEISGADKNMYSNNIRAIFNSKENVDGKYLKLILGTTSIMEGVSFKNVRNVHILNPWWNESRIQQVIARAIRFKSHHDLAPKDRFVNVYRHYSVFAGFPGSYLNSGRVAIEKNISDRARASEKITEISKRGLFNVTIDQHMGNRAAVKKLQSIEFEQNLKASAVDCDLNKYANLTRLEENIKPRYIKKSSSTFTREYNTIDYINPSTGVHFKRVVNNTIDDIIRDDQVSLLKLNITTFTGETTLVSCAKVFPRVRPVTDGNLTGSIAGYYVFEPNGEIILDTRSTDPLLKITNDFIVNENIKCNRENYYTPSTTSKSDTAVSNNIIKKMTNQTIHLKENSKVMVDVLFPRDSKFISLDIELKIKEVLSKFLSGRPALRKDIEKDLGLNDKESASEVKSKQDKIKLLLKDQIQGYTDSMDSFTIGNQILTDDLLTKIAIKSKISEEKYRSIVNDATQVYNLLSGFSVDNITELSKNRDRS